MGCEVPLTVILTFEVRYRPTLSELEIIEYLHIAVQSACRLL